MRVVVKGFLTVMNECAGLRTWDPPRVVRLD